MPRTPRNSPNPPGQPPKRRQVAEALAIAVRTGVSIEEAAKAAGTCAATVHAHKAAKGKGGAVVAQHHPSAPPDPARPPAGSQAPAITPPLPQGGTVSGRPDLLDLVRRILDARNGAARAELDEGLAVAARGEHDLAAWLARPIARAELQGDELDVLREGLGFALGVARTAEPGGAQLRALGILDRIAKSTSVVASRRPREDGPDEVTRRLVAVRDAAIERMGILTSDAAAKLAADRGELAAWCSGLGPIGPEVVRRVDAMLGGPAA